jgi:hypothetical protein
MKRKAVSSTLRGEARTGRSGETCARASQPAADRTRSTWRAPFLRARQAIETASRRLQRSTRAIEAGELFVATCAISSQRHLRELRPLLWTPVLLVRATNRLIAAQKALRDTAARVYELPDDAAAGATALFEATFEIITLLEKAGDLACRMEQIGLRFAEHRAPGGRFAFVVPVEDPATIAARRDLLPPAPPLSNLPYRLPVRNALSAIRRVCRGRAPPALSSPLL